MLQFTSTLGTMRREVTKSDAESHLVSCYSMLLMGQTDERSFRTASDEMTHNNDDKDR